MASRRTRIKVVANIPQRRKTGTTSSGVEENDKQVENPDEIKTEEPNLNPTLEVLHRDKVEEESTNIENAVSVERENVKNGLQEVGRREVSEENCIPKELPKENGDAKLLEVTEAKCESVESKSDAKPNTLPARRKFIKPSVSSNAFNRKSRDSEDVKTVQINHNGARNGKIVILNEVIAYPDQNQPIVIQDHQHTEVNFLPSEGGNHLLKPPDMGVIKPPVNPLEREIRRLVPGSPQIVTPEVEYPIPPPSPSKINRARIKAIPRLGQRHTSFSASESEDECRRNYRHRNDSVCSSASGLQDTNSIPECPSPQKPKEFNSVIQRKCRRTEQSRKLAEARRDFYLKFGNDKPDRQKLTMIDLIFYNPVTNPMSGNRNKRKNSIAESEISEDFKKDEVVDDPKNKTESDEENEIPAPQIKIGPSGEIVVDEQSLVIENKAVKKNREQIEKSEIVNGDNETGYGMYKRVKRSKDWSKEETLKFYKALNTIGTDFSLMCELFPRRTRRELKMKFKKEERVNKNLIDRAIMQPCGFDFEFFKHEAEMEEQELQAIEKQREREKEMKKEAKKRKASIEHEKPPPEKVVKIEKPKPKKKKPLNILSVLDDNSDADESEMESIGDEETEEKFLQTLQKPTRSGRVPKILNKYRAVENKKERPKPGSLIVMATTGANGQPVYKVCMVTGEYSRRQIGEDMTSLEKALECKENGLTSLFTLSASTTEGNLAELTEEYNVSIPAEEHNFTIPAEENNVTIPAPENNVTIPADEKKTISIEENIPEVSEDIKNVVAPPMEGNDLTVPMSVGNNIPISDVKNSTSTEEHVLLNGL